MFEIKELYKSYKNSGKNLSVLEDINLKVCNGEFICVVGPSGCGKSTLLNIISGLEKPLCGEMKNIGKCGFMFQEPTLFPWLKIKDNVGFGLKILKENKKSIERKVDEYLDLVNLKEFKEAYPYELSGGMKQRISLIRTLILEPSILLMDEPFAALDAQTREDMYKVLQDIWVKNKKTVIFVTHNVREAVCLGDRVVVMTARPGRIKNEHRIDLPRPRELSDLEVIKISNEIKDELKQDIQKIIKESEHYEKKYY